jgi:3-oxoacyl-[acyl-carrier protein] reductase
MTSERPVAIVANGSFYVGPALARQLATRGYDLVVGSPKPELVDELSALGARVVGVDDVVTLEEELASERLVDAALDHFGRLDSACAFSGLIVTGRFMKSTEDDLNRVVAGCLTTPYRFLQAVLQPMIAAKSGQILILTSAAGTRPTPGAPLYSAVRAGATMLVRNVADEMAHLGIQVNALGTNFMDFPEFLRANRITDAESRAKVEAQTPMKRLGTMEECAAMCAAFLDGTSRFQTGQFISYTGGW